MSSDVIEDANLCEFGIDTTNRCRKLYRDELVIWNETDTDATIIKLCEDHFRFATMVSGSIDKLRDT